MRKHPRCMLWMVRIHTSAPEESLRIAAQQAGVDPARLVFTRGFKEDVHIKVKSLATLMLDTPGYNAHSSGTDVLWAGLPMVTLVGEKMGGRVAAGLLQALGVVSLQTRTEGDYEAVVCALLRSPRLLGRVRASVSHGKRHAPLFDTQGWVRNSERAMQLAAEVHLSAGARKSMHVIAAA